MEIVTLPNDPGDLLGPNTICLANEDRFTSGNFSEELTEYATGWSDPEGLKAMLDFLAPEVPGPKRFEFAKGAHSDAYQTEGDDVRAVGAPFKTVPCSNTMVPEKCSNKGLTIRVDKDVLATNALWRQSYVGYLLARLYRNDLVRAATGLLAAAANTAKTWDTTAGKDPDQDVLDLVIAAETAGGVANRLVFGQAAWRARFASLRAQDIAGHAASGLASPAQLALAVGVDEIRVSNHRYRSGAAALSRIIGSQVLAFHGEVDPTPSDASSAKRFVSMCEGGTPIRVYEEGRPSLGRVDITVEQYSRIVITADVSVAKLTITP